MIKALEGNVIFPDCVRYAQILIESERISNILFYRDDFVRPDFVADQSQFISPGFVDLQINGGFGKEFKTDSDAVNWVRERITQFGTTAICPTITTRRLETYEEYLAQLRAKLRNHSLGAKFLGFHLEGPFLNPKKVGAQSADLLREPADCRYENYISKDVVIVTLSPELRGAHEFIQRLIADGIKVGIGHSLASYDELVRIFDPNNMMIVHVFNAMADLNSRNPGIVGAALERNDFFVSAIADGIHVDPAVIRILWKAKQDKLKLFGITDGSAVLGLEHGIHNVGTRKIEKRDDRAVLAGTDTLVGSILTLNIAARNLVKFTGCTVNEAVNAVSLSPAIFLGRENDIGQIRIGNSADLIIFDESFDVSLTLVAGNIVWKK
jgi:N-acetylglucosamine-6-phosphate deacetylase